MSGEASLVSRDGRSRDKHIVDLGRQGRCFWLCHGGKPGTTSRVRFVGGRGSHRDTI